MIMGHDMINYKDATASLLASLGMILVAIVLMQFVSCARQDLSAQRIERCAEQFQKNRTEMTAEEIQIILSSCREALSPKIS